MSNLYIKEEHLHVYLLVIVSWIFQPARLMGAFLVLLESSQEGDMHIGGFTRFGPTMW